MIGTTETAAHRRGRKRAGIALGVGLVIVGLAGWYWQKTAAEPSDMPAANATGSAVTAEPVDYRIPRPDVPSLEASAAPEADNTLASANSVFPAGAAPISGTEIVAALSDHTAMLPGGFVEYYAPDGALHGMAEEKHYGGRWEVRAGTFCTLLEGSDARVCSPVERKGSMLYWSLDGEQEASPVSTIPGNPDNLK